MGDGLSAKKSVLQCNIGDNAPVLLCSLLPDTLESCLLNLEFEEEEDVVFSVLGPRSIHLSGYHIGSICARDEDESYPRHMHHKTVFSLPLLYVLVVPFCP